MAFNTSTGAAAETTSAAGSLLARSMEELPWRTRLTSPNSPSWGTPDVNTDGTLYIGGVNLGTGQTWCERSTNAKDSAVTPTFDLSTKVNLGGDIAIGEPINPEGLVGQVFLAIDRSVPGRTTMSI